LFITRLGGGVRDAEEVMAHPFFELINWNDIFHKKVSGIYDTHYTGIVQTFASLPSEFSLYYK